MSRREFLRLGGAGVAGASLLGVAGCGGASSSGEKTLTVGNIGWDENVAVSNLTKVLFERDLGYDKVELQLLDVGLLFEGVASGDLDMFQDVWTPIHDVYLKKLGDEVEHLSPWYTDEARTGLAMPSYMGVGSLTELNGTEAERIVGIESGTEIVRQTEEKVIPAYHLKQELVASSTAAMLSEVSSLYDEKQPFVFMAWSPHWMNEKYDIMYLDDPKGALGAIAEPAKLSSILREDLGEDNPAARAFMQELSLDEALLNGLEAEIQGHGGDAIAGVEAWLEGHRDVVRPWIDAAKGAQG